MATVMDKIRILGTQSKYDICASTSCSGNPSSLKTKNKNPNWLGSTIASGVCHSYTPDGRCVSLFKVLYTNQCIYNCKYCYTQVCKEKAYFTPQEYANVFMKLYMQNICEGVFLTSAVCGDADRTTRDMLDAVHLLRDQYKFRGYIHFKCLPGVSYSLLKEASMLTDRISINIEAPTKEYLSDIASQKDFNNDIITRQRWLKEIRLRHNLEIGKEVQDYQEDNRSNGCGCSGISYSSEPMRVGKNEWVDENNQIRRSSGYLKKNWDGMLVMNSGQTTQFILGAAGESDFDVLKRFTSSLFLSVQSNRRYSFRTSYSNTFR
jgi:predicted DNA-binding helix-hairpin-helix protein